MIVVSVLGLIYLTIRSIALGQSMIIAKLAMGTADEFLHIRHLLGDDNVEDVKLTLQGAKKDVER